MLQVAVPWLSWATCCLRDEWACGYRHRKVRMEAAGTYLLNRFLLGYGSFRPAGSRLSPRSLKGDAHASHRRERPECKSASRNCRYHLEQAPEDPNGRREPDDRDHDRMGGRLLGVGAHAPLLPVSTRPLRGRHRQPEWWKSRGRHLVRPS